MARKPRSSSTVGTPEAAVAPEPATAAKRPSPARRGRPAQVAASPLPAATTRTLEVRSNADDAAGAVPTPPIRRQLGRKPKQARAAVPARQNERTRSAEIASQPSEAKLPPGPAEGDDPIAEMAVPVDALGQNAAEPSAMEVASGASGPDARAARKPAASWDKATDMTYFDWAEIERTAAQDGPNQAMAKLLVATRAEGANARWPL